MCVGEKGGAGAGRGRDRGERVDMNEREWGRGRREENGGGQIQQREGLYLGVKADIPDRT